MTEDAADLEDFGDLKVAIAENVGKPLIPWEQVKAELDLEYLTESDQASDGLNPTGASKGKSKTP